MLSFIFKSGLRKKKKKEKKCIPMGLAANSILFSFTVSNGRVHCLPWMVVKMVWDLGSAKGWKQTLQFLPFLSKSDWNT